MKLVLEARHLFDGSVVAVAHHAAHAVHTHHHHDALHAPGPAHAHHHHGAHQHRHDPLHSVDIPAVAFNPHATEIVFIDTRVANWQTLAAGVKSNVQVVLIDPNRDGLTQVTAALKGHHNLQAIDFISYGSPGQVQLGDSTITADSLASHAAQVASWRDHLSDNAEINFWGCDVGQGSSGQSFVASVHALTGAQVDASTDATGAAALGGNWNLELTTGSLAYSTPFEAAALAAYQGVLDSPLPTVSFEPATVPASVLLGGTFTETIDFTNSAATAVGYGPFIDLFVPQDAAQSATLTGASYLGQAVTIDPVTLSTNIPGHLGVLGALHPVAVDGSGGQLFVAAPAGYTAGDVMYVLVLPFGSFTPGQPAATIDLSFAVNGTTELTSAHGQALNISAIGGFQYGADALNDPGTDPSIRGTTAHQSTTDNTDGMVQTSTAVDLVEVSATTDLHEGETATGPDYPFNYVVTLTPAPVTQGDSINGFDFTFNLPPQVQYSGPFTVPGATVSFTPGPMGADHAGGTVTVHFDTLAANAGGTPITFDIPVFVPQNDSSGHAVLDPTTGAAVTVSDASLYSYSGSWNPTAGSLDHNAPVESFSGDSSTNVDSAEFTAKSLAIQVVDENSGSVVPGAPVQYQINFEVSDYFSLANLNIADVLGDGMTLLAPGDVGYVAPTLSITRDGTQVTGISFGDAATPVSDIVNGQTVAESGGDAGTVWSYSRDDAGTSAAPGSTTLAFNVGMLLESQFGGALGAVLQGGGDTGGITQGSITFTAGVLDKYTNTKGDDSVREKDEITDSVTTAGTSASVVTVAAGVATPTGATVSDDSSVTDEVAPGHAELKVVAVNGDSSNTTVIHPGDVVTYGITYDLTSGDYGSLNLTAYLPEPVFSTSDPTGTPSAPVTAFSQDTTGGATYPGAGQYILTNPGTGETVHSATVNGTANSISFDLGTRDDPTNAPGQAITVYFSVVASSDPYANGLQLTSQATSSYLNAGGVTMAAAAIKQETLTEPEVQIKTGVVSVTNDGGTAKGTYSADPANPNSPWTAQSTSTAPSGAAQSPFGLAGTALANGGVGGTDPLTGNGTPLSADDLSVAGVDGGDMARVVSTVANNGGATAYDVTLQGSLPSGYSAADITNFAIYDSTGHAIDTSVTAAQYFAGTATLTDGIAAGAAVYVVYDLPVHAGQSAGATLDVGASVTNWAGGVAAGQGFVTAGQPVGENAAALSDGATIGITAPTISKTITSASDSTDVPLGANNDVVLGETVQYAVTLTVPEGSITNGGSDIIIQDVLPDGMSFVSIDSVTTGTGINYSGTPTFSLSTDANNHMVLTVDLHVTSITNTNVDAAATFTLNYTLQVTDAAPQAGHAYVNDASLQYDGAPISDASATATQVDPAVTETVGVTDTSSDPVTTIFSGETLDYTVTLHNDANGSQANNLDAFVAVPTSDLAVGIPVVSGDGDGSNPTVTDVGPTTIGGVTYEIYEITDTALKSNGTDTLTFSATVNPNLPAGTQITVGTPDDGTQVLMPGHENASYNSLPTSVGTGHDYTTSGSLSTSIAALTPTLTIIGEANDTSGNGTGLYAEGVSSVAATVGDLVRYSAAVNIPEGQQNDLQVTVTLPSGMQFQNDGTITLLLASPDGSISAVNFGSSASTSYSGTFDSAAAKATFTLPASDITVHPDGSVTFDLGQINDNEGSSSPNYAIIQFNGLVENASTVTNGSSLAAHATVGTQNSADATVTVDEPNVTLTKTVTSIDNGDGTASIHITETVTNNSTDATAYNVALDDPEGNNTGVLSGVAETGAGGLIITSGNGTHDLQASGSLAAGASNTFTYVETVTDPTQGVSDATATVTYTSLSNAAGGVGGETLAGSVTGTSGTGTGSRDGSGGSSSALNDYISQATIGFGVASGHVWNDIGPDASQFGETGSHDTNLAGVTVTGTFGGITETAATDTGGDYSMIVVEGAGTISMPTPGTGGLASNETLFYNDGNPVATPVTITADPGAAQTNVDFSFKTPDTAPTIAGWGDSTVNPVNPVSVTYTEGTPVVLATGASVTDTQIDETSHDYDGSVLTVQRYNSDGTVDTNPADAARDQFVGTGLLVLGTGADTTVTYNGTLVGHYTEINGVLKLTFDAGATSATTVNSVLDALGYQGSDSNTISTGIKIGATLDDHNQGQQQGTGGDMTSAPAFVTVYETPAPGTATFTDPNDTSATAAAVALDGSVIVSSSDTFDSATISFGANYRNGEDILGGGTADGFTSSFDVTTGVLTLTKVGATAAQLQDALRSVTYSDALDMPNTAAARTLDISVHDHTTGVDTPLTQVTLSVVAENDSPVLHDNPVALTDAPGDSGEPSGEVGTLVSALTGSGNVTDTDSANAHDGATPGLTGIAITVADTTAGTWWYTTDDGVTWTPFASSSLPAISATNALHLVADANTRIYFQASTAQSGGQISQALTFHGWDQYDGVPNGTLLALPTDSVFGSGVGTDASAYSLATQTLPLQIDSDHTVNQTFTEPNGTAGDANAVTVDSTVVLSSTDTYSSATVTIGNAQGEDHLIFTPSADTGDILASFSGGVLTLTSAGGSATAAQIQAALRAVQYFDSSDTPITTERTLSLSTVDVTSSADVVLDATTMTIVPGNDSPVLHGNPVTLGDATEDAGPPSGALGTLVSSLTGGGNVTDVDGANAHDGATPGTAGIAVVGADTSQGNWWYSTDGGNTWTEFAGAGLPAVSGSNALHLVGDANTRIYFEPNHNWNGVIPAALTMRGWDQNDGAANGSLSALPTDSALGTGSNTLASAYSTATQTLQLAVTASNDAPLASGGASLAPTTEDTANQPGDTVSGLFGSSFNDSADQQQGAGNPSGSTADTLAGIAITGNAATADQGAWQYSTDNGAHWTTVPSGGLGDANAIVLPDSAELRFVPSANFNGTPGQLTTRLIDSSSSVVTAGLTGLDLSTGTTAFTGVDVSGAHNGGTTAVSASSVGLDTLVSAVNDAPLASGDASLAPTPSGERNPPGDTVGDLFGGSFNDSTDQQHSATNPTGSSADTLAGIAITGNALTTGGSWQYSTDGVNWTTVPTDLGEHDALILAAGTKLRFVSTPGFIGEPGGLTAHLIDSSAGPLAGAASGVDLGATGGITPYSSATVHLNTTVTRAGGVPIRSAPGSDAPPDPNLIFDTGNDAGDLGEIGDNGTAFTPDFLHRPIIPQVSLIGSVGNRFVIVEQRSVIAVPSNLFVDSYPGAFLQYDARSPDGGALPPWLTFDPRNLTFTGTPPRSAHGAVDVLIVARDQFGNEATASFRILVGRDSDDLQHLLSVLPPEPRQAHQAAGAARHAAQHGRTAHDGPAPAGTTGAHAGSHAQDHAHPQHHGQHDALQGAGLDGAAQNPAFAALPPAAPAHGRAAFSAQLREAGPTGRLLQARQILDAITQIVPIEPLA